MRKYIFREAASFSVPEVPVTTDANTSVDLSGRQEYMRSNAMTVGAVNEWSLGAWLKVLGTEEGDLVTVAATLNLRNRIRLSRVSGEGLRVEVHDFQGVNNIEYVFDDFFAGWTHAGLSFDGGLADGSQLTVYRNGVAQTPSTVVTEPGITMTDTARKVALSNIVFSTAGGARVRVHQAAMWSEPLTAQEWLGVAGRTDAPNFDLNTNSAGYQSSAELIHWWRPGFNPAAMGADYADSPPTTHNLMADAKQVSDNDIVADFPAPLDQKSVWLSRATTQSSGRRMQRDNISGLGLVASGGTVGFTFACWARPLALQSSTTAIAMKGDALDTAAATRANTWYVNFVGTSSPTMGITIWDKAGANRKVYNTTPAFSPEEFVSGFHHFAFSYDGTDLKLYFDGEEQNTTKVIDQTVTIDDAVDDFALGNGILDVANSVAGSMLLHSAMAWRRVLTSGELIELADPVSGGVLDPTVDATTYSASGLAAWWPLGRDATSGVAIGNEVVSAEAFSLTNFTNALDEANPVRDDWPGGQRDFDYSAIFLQRVPSQIAESNAATIGIAEEWTVAGWFNTGSVSPAIIDGWLAIDGSDDNSIELLQSGAVAEINVYNSAGTLFKRWQFGTVSGVNEFHHFAVTWDGSTLRVYQNGEDLDNSANKLIDNAGTMIDSSRTVIHNGRLGAVEPNQGRTFATAVWSVALTSGEVFAISREGDTAREFDLRNDAGAYQSASGLEHWWRWNDPSDFGKDSGSGTAIDAMPSPPAGVAIEDLVAWAPGDDVTSV